MEFLKSIDASKYNAIVSPGKADAGDPRKPTLSVALASGVTLIIENPPFGAASVPVAAVEGAVETLIWLADRSHTTLRNVKLSQVGKDEELKAPRERAINEMANAWRTLRGFEASVERAEEEFYAMPRLPAGDAAAVLLDQEVRAEVRAGGLEFITELAKQVNNLDVEGSDELLRQIGALLRSPVKIAAAEKIIGEAWKGYRDKVDRAGRAALDLDAASADWSRRQLFVVAHHVATVSRLPRQVIAKLTAEGGGHAVFGIPVGEAVAASRAQAA